MITPKRRICCYSTGFTVQWWVHYRVRLAIHEGYATAKRTINDEDALAAVGQTGVQKLKAMESYKKKK